MCVRSFVPDTADTVYLGNPLLHLQWDYVSSLKERCRELGAGVVGSLDIDTNICADSYEAAAVAAGAACRAVDRVAAAASAPRHVFVAVRPPGHHAGPRGRVLGPDGEGSSSQGFCLLNSVAIAAAYARYNYRGLFERVAIVDFDAHYGDGTAACVLNLVPGTHQASYGHGLRISTPSYKPWLDETDPDKVLQRRLENLSCIATLMRQLTVNDGRFCSHLCICNMRGSIPIIALALKGRRRA